MPAVSPERFQSRFHRCWGALRDPHVRALAWLLDAPELLDPAAPQWKGRIATLGPVSPETADWLHALDRSPLELHEYLGVQPFTRLGRYAERLMAFYFRQQGTLVEHGLQVRNETDGKHETIGEFDFLLRLDGVLIHWEFASKFYLLESGRTNLQADCFVGPNLADTLGVKMRKIMERQLFLSRHPAARAYLPEPVAGAQALVKGWLFYHGQTPVALPGVATAHCHGFWRPFSELDEVAGDNFLVLPRLSWLAPAREHAEQGLTRHQVRDRLGAHFAGDPMPVLIAIMDRSGDELVESDRGFIVPDDWRSRAGERIGRMIAAAAD